MGGGVSAISDDFDVVATVVTGTEAFVDVIQEPIEQTSVQCLGAVPKTGTEITRLQTTPHGCEI